MEGVGGVGGVGVVASVNGGATSNVFRMPKGTGYVALFSVSTVAVTVNVWVEFGVIPSSAN
jgi:hypothetical protein